MTADGFVVSACVAGCVLLAATLAGWFLAPFFVPPGRGQGLERAAWALAIALGLLATHVVVAFALGLRPGWASLLVLVALAFAAARPFRLPASGPRAEPGARRSVAVAVAEGLLLALILVGISGYLARSLAEPMWSNDFLAVWGLKGKSLFARVGIPEILFRSREFEFSNPSYPLGLPLVYAGIAFLMGRWDDHALALIFPAIQVATLLLLVGWLRRRRLERPLALAAAALVANGGALYSAWLTGMAEVPASLTFLLFGTSVWDVRDGDAGAVRRLALASALAAGTKNEGLLLLATGGLVLALSARQVRRRGRWPWTAAAAIVVPGLASVALHRLTLGAHAVRGLDPGLLTAPGLAARVSDTAREELLQLVRPAWPALAGLAVLLLARPRALHANPIVALVGASTLVYLGLPVICPFGPGWLVHWTIGRITCALFPLLIAGIGAQWIGAWPDGPWAPWRTSRTSLASVGR